MTNFITVKERGIRFHFYDDFEDTPLSREAIHFAHLDDYGNPTPTTQILFQVHAYGRVYLRLTPFKDPIVSPTRYTLRVCSKQGTRSPLVILVHTKKKFALDRPIPQVIFWTLDAIAKKIGLAPTIEEFFFNEQNILTQGSASKDS
jgi:hypothetical protein